MTPRVQNCCWVNETNSEHGEYHLKRGLHVHPQCKDWILFAFIDVPFYAKKPIKRSSIDVIKEQLIK